MSNNVDFISDPKDAIVAEFLSNNDGEELTNILVEALDEAFRILNEELTFETLH